MPNHLSTTEGPDPSAMAAPHPFGSYIMDNKYQQPNTSAQSTSYGQANGQLAYQSCPSAVTHSTYDFNLHSGSRNQLYPSRDFRTNPVRQSSVTSPIFTPWPPYHDVTCYQEDQLCTSPFSAPWEFRNSVADSTGRRSLNPSSDYAIAPYVPHQYGQYGSAESTNSTYSTNDPNFFQHTSTLPHPEPIYDHTESSVAGAKPHSCPSCGKSFARKGDMERHARVHRAPHLRCDVEGCKSRGFYRTDKYKEHLKKHESRYGRS